MSAHHTGVERVLWGLLQSACSDVFGQNTGQFMLDYDNFYFGQVANAFASSLLFTWPKY